MPIDDASNPESYALLCSQLRAAAEKRTSQLSKTVMNDLLANVDGGAKGFKRDPDDIHRTHHAGAEPTRLQEHDPFRGVQIGSWAVGGGGFDGVRSHNP